jgi:cytochrome P450
LKYFTANFKIPAGTSVTILAHQLHTDERYWGEDVLTFNPDRFLPENIAKVHPYAYIPFSSGPRICLGHRFAMCTVKTYLSLFLRKYRVTTSLKLEDITVQTIFTLHIKQGFMVKVERR